MLSTMRHFLFLALTVCLGTAHAQEAPKIFNFDGQLMDTSGNPVTDNATIRLQILDPNENCLLFDEQHALSNLSATNGRFSVPVGMGTRTPSYDASLDLHVVFRNSGTIRAPGSPNCAPGYALNPGDSDARAIRIIIVSVGAATVNEALTSQLIHSAPFAMTASTLQGKVPDDFVKTTTDVTQTKANDLFIPATYNEILALAAGSSTQYAKAGGGNFSPAADLSMNSKKLTNLATPTLGTDATNKDYVDTKIIGKGIDVTGMSSLTTTTGNGKILSWDAANNRWTASAVNDSSKLPLAGGLMTGDIDMGDKDIANSGYITQKVRSYVQLGRYSNSEETTQTMPMGTTHEGALWFNKQQSEVRYWSGTGVQRLLTYDLGDGKIWVGFGSNATQVTMSGDVTMTNTGVTSIGSGVVNNTHISDVGVDKITSATGKYLTYAPNNVACTNGDTLKWNGTQWLCGADNAGSGGIASVGVSGAPLSITNPTTTPVVSISQANTTTGGYISATDFNAFSGKLPDTLPSGEVFVGNGSGKAAGRKLIVTDIKDSFTGGSAAIPLACTADQYWSWNAVTGKFDCVDIAIDASQVANLPAGTVTSVTSGGVPITIGGTSAAPTVSISQASGTSGGYLSSTDYTAFSSKVTSISGAGAISISGTTAPVVHLNPTGGLAGSTGSISISDLGVSSAKIADKAVDFSKIQDIATNKIVGRSSSGSGALEEITVGTGLSLSGGTLVSTYAGIGTDSVLASHIDANAVTASELADNAVDTNAIGDDQVTFAKLQNIASGKLIGRTTASSGDAEEITVSTGLSLTGGVLSSTVTGLGANNVGASHIAADAVGTSELADGAVDTNAIANSAVTDAKISGMSVDKLSYASGKYFTYAPNGTACGPNDVLKWSSTAPTGWICGTDNAGSAGITSLSVSAPLSSTGGATPTLSVSMASNSASGYLSSTDWGTFNGKLGTTLSNGYVMIGGVGNVVSPRNLAVGDLKGADGTTPSFPINCTADETLSWLSPANVFQCVPISIDASQVANLPTGTVTGVTGSGPITVGGTAAVPSVGLNLGDGLELNSSAVRVKMASASSLIVDSNGVKVDTGTGTNKIPKFNASGHLSLGAGNLSTTGTVTGTSFSGSGSGLTSLNASNLSSGTIPLAVMPSGLLLDGGNTVTSALKVGTANSHNLQLIANNNPLLTIFPTGGTVGIGDFSSRQPEFMVEVIKDNFANIGVTSYSAVINSGPELVLRKARGTSSAPTAIMDGDRIGSLFFSGHDGTGNFPVKQSAGIVGFAKGNYVNTASPVATNHGSEIAFETTEAGFLSSTRAERMRIGHNGNVGIGVTDPGSGPAKLQVNGAIKIGSQTTCGSGDIGTIRFSGGIQFCNGSSWASPGGSGGDLKSDGSVTMAQNFQVGTNAVVFSGTSGNIGLRAPASTVTGAYTLPANLPTGPNQVLGSTTGGQMSWVTPPGGSGLVSVVNFSPPTITGTSSTSTLALGSAKIQILTLPTSGGTDDFEIYCMTPGVDGQELQLIFTNTMAVASTDAKASITLRNGCTNGGAAPILILNTAFYQSAGGTQGSAASFVYSTSMGGWVATTWTP